MIGGNDDNHLFKILKDNGYHITFLTMDSHYYFQIQGPNLDATDIGSMLFTPLSDLNPRRFRPLVAIFSKRRAEDGFQGTLADQAVERGQQRGGPFMVIFKGGANHVHRKYYRSFRGSQKEFEAWKAEYLKLVARGDGAWGYRSVFQQSYHSGDMELFSRQLTERGVTLDEVAQDTFGVFQAIRLPGGEGRDLSQGMALNPVNLFRHVFAYLNDDPSLLNTREPAVSYMWSRFILGRDNQPVLELY